MEQKSLKDSLLRGIALLGLIVILVLGAWGVIVLAFNVPNILSSAGTTIAGFFGENDEEDEGDTVEVPVVSTSTSSTKPASTSSSQPTYTYTPAATQAATLYGFPDLAVRILSVVPQGSRYSMQFEVANYGTNIAGAGWNFTARLPIANNYTFTSAPQQMLRPGDKIVYTLGFDAPYYGPNYSYNYDDEDEERYDECGDNHDHWDSDDWFDWYQDTWDTSSDAREDWDEDEWEDWYDDFCDDRDDNNDDDDYYYGGNSNGVITVTANPFGQIYESNRFNNAASQTVNFNYYPSYPGYPYYPYQY